MLHLFHDWKVDGCDDVHVSDGLALYDIDRVETIGGRVCLYSEAIRLLYDEKIKNEVDAETLFTEKDSLECEVDDLEEEVEELRKEVNRLRNDNNFLQRRVSELSNGFQKG